MDLHTSQNGGKGQQQQRSGSGSGHQSASDQYPLFPPIPNTITTTQMTIPSSQYPQTPQQQLSIDVDDALLTYTPEKLNTPSMYRTLPQDMEYLRYSYDQNAVDAELNADRLQPLVDSSLIPFVSRTLVSSNLTMEPPQGYNYNMLPSYNTPQHHMMPQQSQQWLYPQNDQHALPQQQSVPQPQQPQHSQQQLMMMPSGSAIDSDAVSSVAVGNGDPTALTPGPGAMTRKRRPRRPETWKRNNYRRKVLPDKGACRCQKQCYSNIPEYERLRIREEFSILPKVRQDHMLLSCIVIDPKGTGETSRVARSPQENGAASNGDDSSSDDDAEYESKQADSSEATKSSTMRAKGRQNKQFSATYFVRYLDPVTQQLTNVPVCHHAFLSVHGIGKKRVRNLVQNAYESGTRVPKQDLRGRHGNRANRVSDDLVVLAEKHIHAFPRYRLHGCLNFDPLNVLSTHGAEQQMHYSSGSIASGSDKPAITQLNPNRLPARFLSPNLTIARMYRLFVAHYQPVLLQLEGRAPNVKQEKGRRSSKQVAGNASGPTQSPTNGLEAHDVVLPTWSASSSSSLDLLFPEDSARPMSDTSVSQSNVSSKRESSSNDLTASKNIFPGLMQQALSCGAASAAMDTEFFQLRQMDQATLNRTLSELPCSRCFQPQTQYLPVFWLPTGKVPGKKFATGEDRPTADDPPMQLLGVFCSEQCVQEFNQSLSVLRKQGFDHRLTHPTEAWRGLPMPHSAEKTLKPLVSRDKYERLFRGLNLRFGSAKPESCPLCNEFAVRIEAVKQRGDDALLSFAQPSAAKTTTSLNERDVNSDQLRGAWLDHLSRAKRAFDMLAHDKRLAVDSWTKYRQLKPPTAAGQFAPATFDLLEVSFQPNRPVPQFPPNQLPNDSVLYRRQSWVYVYGVYSAVTQTAHPYMWDEQTARRGINEVLSCLWSYIFAQRARVPRSPWLIMFGEGRLRNYWAAAFLAELCREESPFFAYRRIDYKVLEPGHTHMEQSDRPLAGLDREGRSVAVYQPKDWFTQAQALGEKKGGGKLQPRWMTRENIYDWKSVLRPLYTKKFTAMDTNGQPLDLSSAVWFNFGVARSMDPNGIGGVIEGPLTYHAHEVWVRFSLDDREPWSKVCLRRFTASPNMTPEVTMHGMVPSSSSVTHPSVAAAAGAPTLATKPGPLRPLYLPDAPPLPLSKAKSRDLAKLRKYVPAEFQHLYPVDESRPSGERRASLHTSPRGSAVDHGGSIDTEVEIEMEPDDNFARPEPGSSAMLLANGSGVAGNLIAQRPLAQLTAVLQKTSDTLLSHAISNIASLAPAATIPPELNTPLNVLPAPTALPQATPPNLPNLNSPLFKASVLNAAAAIPQLTMATTIQSMQPQLASLHMPSPAPLPVPQQQQQQLYQATQVPMLPSMYNAHGHLAPHPSMLFAHQAYAQMHQQQQLHAQQMHHHE